MLDDSGRINAAAAAMAALTPASLVQQLVSVQRGIEEAADAERAAAEATADGTSGAAAAADVKNLLALDGRNTINPVQPQRVDLVQGTKFSLHVPPAVSEVGKLG